MDTTFETLINLVKKYNDNEKDFILIRKAYDFAKKAHGGQKRRSGDDFVIHPLGVAIILAEKRMDHESICAALLHDVAEDVGVNFDDIRRDFDDDTANLVEGVTKLEKMRFTTKEDYNAENLRKMLLATSKDARVMILKLADRLDNMRTLNIFPIDKQKRIAQETLDIYAPISHKLGMWHTKGELEDMSLRYLNPEVYSFLKKKINEKRGERELRTTELMDDFLKKLSKININAQISGRAKYFYSIYKKMQKKGKTFDEINDLLAIRIIANNISECYIILDVINKLFKPIEGRFKDYIKNPKKNGYQSLHVDVRTQDNKILEMQIRTQEMHNQAEEGVAAHWQYKQTERDKKFDKKIGWLKQILEWKSETKGREFIEDLKIDLFQDEVVILTPKSDPLILPEDSTPVDFAFAIHTNVGFTCSKAEVNGKIVPLDYKLKSGDRCRIITQKNAKPSRTWLNYIKTGKAKTKVRSFLGISLDKDPKTMRAAEELGKMETYLVKYLDYEGKRNIKLSKCCNPQFKDLIKALQTKDGTITVHKVGCPNLAGIGNQKLVPIGWILEDKSIRTILISVKDRIGLIYDILNASIESKNQVLSINIKTIKTNLLITLKIKAESLLTRKDLIDILTKIKDVHSVTLKKR